MKERFIVRLLILIYWKNLTVTLALWMVSFFAFMVILIIPLRVYLQGSFQSNFAGWTPNYKACAEWILKRLCSWLFFILRWSENVHNMFSDKKRTYLHIKNFIFLNLFRLDSPLLEEYFPILANKYAAS